MLFYIPLNFILQPAPLNVTSRSHVNFTIAGSEAYARRSLRPFEQWGIITVHNTGPRFLQSRPKDLRNWFAFNDKPRILRTNGNAKGNDSC